MNAEDVKTREQEVSLVNLIVDILLRWRVILCVMLLGGVLVGGFSFVRSLQNISAQQKQLDEQERILAEQAESNYEEKWETGRQLLVEQLTKDQFDHVTITLMYKQLFEEKLAYQQESMLMKIDPFHVQQAEISFLIKSDDIEKTYNIEKLYEGQVTDAALYNYVKEQCDMEGDVSELIMLDGVSVENLSNRNKSYVIISEMSQDTLNIRVWHNDAIVCRAMADAVVRYMQQRQDELVNTVGDHELVLLSLSQCEVVNADIAIYQAQCVADIQNYQSIHTILRGEFTGKERQYYDYMLETDLTKNVDSGLQNAVEENNVNDNQDIQINTIRTMAPSISVKYVLLGVVLFGAAYILVAFLQYILNNKVRITDTFQGLYGIPQLGTVSMPLKKRFLGVIDQWILKLRYHSQRKFNFEESLELATVALKMVARKKALNQVYMIGCNLKGSQAKIFCEKLKGNLKKDNILIEVLDNVLYNAEALEKLEGAQGAVLVETVGSTLYEEIEKELQLLNRLSIHVLGGILVE